MDKAQMAVTAALIELGPEATVADVGYAAYRMAADGWEPSVADIFREFFAVECERAGDVHSAELARKGVYDPYHWFRAAMKVLEYREDVASAVSRAAAKEKEGWE